MPSFEHLQDAFVHVLLWPLLLAAALMTLLVVAGWLAKCRDAMAQLGSAIALAAGLALGLWLRAALPLTQFPGPAAWDWLPWVTAAALAVGAIAHLPGVPAGVGWGLRGTVAAHAGWLLTPGDLRNEFLWAPLVLGAVVLAEWAVHEQLDWNGLTPLAVALPAATASVVLIYAGSAPFHEIALILTGALFGVGLAAVVLRAQAGAASAGVVVILPALLLAGSYTTDTEVPKASFALVALAPLTLAASLLPAWQRRQKKGLWAVQFLLLVLPLAAAVLLAAQYESLEYD